MDRESCRNAIAGGDGAGMRGAMEIALGSGRRLDIGSDAAAGDLRRTDLPYRLLSIWHVDGPQMALLRIGFDFVLSRGRGVSAAQRDGDIRGRLGEAGSGGLAPRTSGDRVCDRVGPALDDVVEPRSSGSAADCLAPDGGGRVGPVGSPGSRPGW